MVAEMPQVQTDFNDFNKLMESASNGSQEAASELVQCHSGYIRRVVRRYLPDRIRTQFDSIDFVQATWHDVFVDAPRLATFGEQHAFLGYLGAVAAHKVQSATRSRFEAQKRDITREQSLDKAADQWGNELPAGDPTPSAVAAMRERWDLFLASQPEH